MHASAFNLVKVFFDQYISDKTGLVIVQIGAIDNDIKTITPLEGNFLFRLDTKSEEGVDVIMRSQYVIPFENNSIDVIIASSTFESCEFFWVLMLEINRVLKSTGIFYLNSATNGYFRRKDYDYWRFYPDSGIALQNWCIYSGYSDFILLESFVGDQTDEEGWNDFVAVFLKDKNYIERYPYRMLTVYPYFSNGMTHEDREIINFNTVPEDKLM